MSQFSDAEKAGFNPYEYSRNQRADEILNREQVPDTIPDWMIEEQD